MKPELWLPSKRAQRRFENGEKGQFLGVVAATAVLKTQKFCHFQSVIEIGLNTQKYALNTALES